METKNATPSPGQRARVVQEAQARAATWRTTVEGVVVSCEPQPTGSWHAHGRGGRLWLQRLRLRKDDGELVDLVLDAGSSVTVLDVNPALVACRSSNAHPGPLPDGRGSDRPAQRTS